MSQKEHQLATKDLRLSKEVSGHQTLSLSRRRCLRCHLQACHPNAMLPSRTEQQLVVVGQVSHYITRASRTSKATYVNTRAVQQSGEVKENVERLRECSGSSLNDNSPAHNSIITVRKTFVADQPIHTLPSRILRSPIS